MVKIHTFTLVETLITLLMVAVIVPVVATGFQQLVKLNGEDSKRYEAAEMGSRMLDEWRADDDWDNVAEAGDFGVTLPNYSWAFEKTTWEGDDTGAITQGRLTVTYVAGGRENTVVLTTLINEAQSLDGGNQ